MRFFLDGITASMLRSERSLRVSLQSYALSARSFSTLCSSGRRQSIIVFQIGVSEVFPGVSMNERISLILTVKAWILVVSHPLDLQSAWGPFFSVLKKHMDVPAQWWNREIQYGYPSFVSFEAWEGFFQILKRIPIECIEYILYASSHRIQEVFSTDNQLSEHRVFLQWLFDQKVWMGVLLSLYWYFEEEVSR